MPSETLSMRLKNVRNHCKMNQKEFAKSINLGQSTWAMIEIQKRKLLDRHIKLICTVHGINEYWLRTGAGEMLSKIKVDDEYIHASNLLLTSNDDFAKQIIKEYSKLDANTRIAVRSFFNRVLNNSKE